MQLVQLFVQIEAAHFSVDELGKLGLIEFRDVKPDVSAFQRNFLNKVRRCNEMEGEIRFFEHQLSAEVKDMMAGKKWIYQFFKMVYGRRKQRVCPRTN